MNLLPASSQFSRGLHRREVHGWARAPAGRGARAFTPASASSGSPEPRVFHGSPEAPCAALPRRPPGHSDARAAGTAAESGGQSMAGLDEHGELGEDELDGGEWSRAQAFC